MQTVVNAPTRKINKRRNRWLIAAGVLVIATIGFLAVRGLNGSEAAAANAGVVIDPDDVTTAAFGDIASGVTASGQVEPLNEANLSLKVAGTAAAVNVKPGDAVAAGDVLVQLETNSLERAVVQAEQNLIIQEVNLARLTVPASAADIASAEASLASAQAALDDALAGPSAAETASSQAGLNDAAIRSAEVSLVSAQQAHANAIEAYNSAWDPGRDWELNDPLRADRLEAEREGTANSLALAEAQLASAQAALSNAYGQYNAALASYDQVISGSSSAQIAAAKASLAQAQAGLDQVLSGAAEEDITVAEVQVTQARLNLEEAQDNLANATLRAPYDGVIAAVYVGVGEQASGLAVDMISSSGMQVILNVDENDLGLLFVGQETVITLETWPDDVIDGTVTAIEPLGKTNSSGIVTFAVHVMLGETDRPVRPGMTADGELITATKSDVLLVPNAALTADREAGTYSVNRISRANDGTLTAETIPVTIGINDGRFTEITGGLDAGDEVLLGNLVAPVQQNGFGPGGDGPFGN